MGAIVSAVGAIAGAIGAGGSLFTNPLVKILGGIGLQLLGRKYSNKGKKSKNSSQSSGTRLETTSGGSQSREIGSGLFATAGQEISPAITFGKENKTAVKVIILSDFRIDGVNRVAISNIWCDLTGDNNTERGYGVTGDTSKFVRIKIYKGDPNQQADAYLVKNSGGRWTAQHRGAGLAYAIISVDYDAEKMTAFPDFVFECRGVAYDPRFDSSVGGNGAQRYEDTATWGYSDNPIVQLYTYSRGYHINGQLIAGKEMPARDLPLPAWIAAMNVCDEPIASEYNQNRYRGGAIFTADGSVTHRDNMQPLLDACAGDMVERVDGDVPLVGMTRPIVARLNDDDLIVGERAVYKAKRSRAELINSVFGSYNEPAKVWNTVSYPAQIDDAAQNADGERHAKQIDFKAVFSPQQAVRLAQAILRENRYQASATIVVRPRWIVLEVGDWIDLTFKDFGTKTYEVRARSLAALGPNGARNVTLTLQEVGSGIYDNSVDIPELPVVVQPAEPVLQQFPDGLRVAAALAESKENKRKIPVIVVSWDAPTDVITVRGVLIELWKTSEPDRKIQFQVRQPQNSYTISGGLLPKETYSVRATVIPDLFRMTLWSKEVTVVTTEEEVGIDVEEISKAVSVGNEWGYANLAKIRQELDYLASMVADSAAAGFQAADELRQTIDVKMAQNDASYTKQITVAVSETKAIAARIEAVEVNVNNNIAQSINEIRAEINEKGQATAESLNALNAKVGEVSSNITMRAQAVAGDGSGSARLVLQLRSGTSTDWKNVSMQMDTDNGGNIYFDANRFFFTSDNGKFVPASLVDGVWRSNFADIGSVKAGELNINNRFKVSRDGTLEVSGASGSGRTVLTNSRYEVYDNNGRIRVRLGVW